MAKYKLQVITNEKGQKKTKTIKYSTNDNETVQVNYSVNKGDKKLLGEITYGPDDSPPPTPEPVDKTPEVSAGEDIDTLEGQEVTLVGVVNDFDEDDIEDTVWKGPDGITLIPDESDDSKSKFTTPNIPDGMDVLGLVFTFTAVDKAGHVATDSSIVTVRRKLVEEPPEEPEEPPKPEPEEPPQEGELIWSSNRDGKWNDGNKRTITVKQGGQKPNDKSIFVAASGSPKFVIDGDGVGHLVSGSGGVDNLSLKLNSRHQEGGECDNRFGGHGCSIDAQEINFKTETCHNIHTNSKSFKHGIDIGEEWHVIEFSRKGSKVICVVDGKKIGEHGISDNQKENCMINSMVWLRLNNSDHGRIYICAINYDAKLKVPFKFEPSTNSIAFKDVELTAL